MPARYRFDSGSGRYIDTTGRSKPPDPVILERALQVAERSDNPVLREDTRQLRAGEITLDEWQRRFRGGAKAGARIVSRETVRLGIDRALVNTNKDAQSLARDLQSGKIGLREWRTGMRQIVKDSHLYAATAAKGGEDAMTQADYGRVGQILSRGPRAGRGQYQYLESFLREIERGLPLNGRFLQRVRLYVEAARSTYHVFDRLVHEALGYTEERNIRFAGDSCDGCIAAEALGWVPIGTLVPIGRRDCVGNCRCRIEYRKTPAREKRPRTPRRAPRREAA